MGVLQPLLSGVAGAGALTLAHQVLQQVTSDAPRMDVLGERAIAQGMRAVGQEPPSRERLYEAAMAGDLVSNSLYYSLVGLSEPERAPLCGAILGLTAGIGGVLLPGPLGLGHRPSARNPTTAALTVGLYTLGGLVAGLAYQQLADKKA